MSIKSQKDLLALMKIGQIVGQTLRYMQEQLRAGMTTEELDAFGADFLEKRGAQSAPRLMYKFPGTTCISINDEAAHGIPGKRVIQPGDLVNIDVSAELDGYFADSGASIPVSPVAGVTERLCKATRAALNRAIDSARAGQPINVIGKAVEVEAKRGNFKIVRDLGGHGVGRSLHEAPRNVLNYYDPGLTTRLTEGMVLTIEPFLSTHATRTTQADDGWTLRTPNSLVAQFEHTLVITRNKPILTTAV